MQDKNIPNVKNRLLSLAVYVNTKGIRGLAAYLGVPDSSLYSWISRNSIGDTGSILKKIPNARVEWLETGEGEMLASSEKPSISEAIGDGYSPEVKLAADYLEVKLKGKSAEEKLKFIEDLMEEIRRKNK